MAPQPSDWRRLAEQASKEMDPCKLIVAVMELNQVLEGEETRRKQQCAGSRVTK